MQCVKCNSPVIPPYSVAYDELGQERKLYCSLCCSIKDFPANLFFNDEDNSCLYKKVLLISINPAMFQETKRVYREYRDRKKLSKQKYQRH